MDTRHLVDAIVRQTTVLIAQLATAAGLRTPLAQVADQVFLELARELESQGVGRKVAADMFGLALRGYQKKVARLSESRTHREQTLWQAVLSFLDESGGCRRRELLERFERDGYDDVAAVLRDLLDTGLIAATGRTEIAFYQLASEEARRALAADEEVDAIAGLLLLQIYEHRHVARTALLDAADYERELAERAIDRLVDHGRIDSAEQDGEQILSCARVHIPLGAAHGWEAAVFDHFRAMATAIAAKVRGVGPRSQEDDLIGGATLSFRIHAGHPNAREVEGLLSRVRAEVNELWARVSEYNREHVPKEGEEREVTFYFGQTVVDAGGEENGDG
ncbi:MAG: hypothetical protein OEZ06_31595 [Myxococcales bacterium]|nr:hypothetical protein [Myxococcales bacterium]